MPSKIHLVFHVNPLPQKGIVIVDIPGVGESDEMDEMVVQYLPEAFAFIYGINCANAGGVQKDRVSVGVERYWSFRSIIDSALVAMVSWKKKFTCISNSVSYESFVPVKYDPFGHKRLKR